MSVDMLQDKIRKMKNPSMVDFGIRADQIPPQLLEEEETYVKAYARFCRELLLGLKDSVPAVRFSFGAFALLGPEGLTALSQLLQEAEGLGYFILLDAPEILSPWDADRIAKTIFEENAYPCHGVLASPYIGTDAMKPFLPKCKSGEKTLFLAVRSPNKSALEIQDLLTGSRLVHIAVMDLVNRQGDGMFGKCGYSRVGAAVSAAAPSGIASIRKKYNRSFLMVDGVDYPNGNYKNCTSAFDQFGHGAVVCAGPSVTAAWTQDGADSREYVALAQQAAERMKKNLARYVTVL